MVAMETPPSPGSGQQRGRSILPSRGIRAYSSSPRGHRGQQQPPAFVFRKSERSPHVSYDRITRHASPSGGQIADYHDDQILPRVPQPYRTSFSAVTSPHRIPRRSLDHVSGQGCLGLARDQPVRATMPLPTTTSGRLSSQTKSEDGLDSPTPGGGGGKARHGSESNMRESRLSDGGSFLRLDARYASTPASVQSGVGVSARCTRRAPPSTASALSRANTTRTESVADSVFQDGATETHARPLDDSVVRDFMKDSDSEKVLSNGGLHSELFPSEEDLLQDTVETQVLISKEYVHQRSVTYFELLEKQRTKKLHPPNEQTHRVLGAVFGIFRRSRSADRPPNDKGSHMARKTGSVDALEVDKDFGYLGSNVSLPPEALLRTNKDKPEKVKKASSSSNVWNIFKRLSPKALRRGRRSQSAGRMSVRSSDTTPGNSSSNLHLVTVDIGNESTAKSFEALNNKHPAAKASKSSKKTTKSPKSPKKKKVPTATLR